MPGGRRVSYGESSAALTGWERGADFAFLREVSSVPPPRHLRARFTDFFAKRAEYPAFKPRKRSRASAEHTRSAFRWRNGQLTPAKMDAPVARVHARIAARRRDYSHKVTTRLVRDNRVIAVEDRDGGAAKNILAAGPRRGETPVELV